MPGPAMAVEEINHLTSNYGPLTRMAEKAAALRQEIQELDADVKSPRKHKSLSFHHFFDESLPASPTPKSPRRLDSVPSSQQPLKRSSTGAIPMLTRAGTLAARGGVPRGLYDPASNGFLHENLASLESALAQAKADSIAAHKELDRRQDSYIRREDALLQRVQQLEEQLAATRGERSQYQEALAGAAGKGGGRELQQQVVQGLGDLLERQREQLKVEEASALRQFRSRLLAMEVALEAERCSQMDQQTPLLRQMKDLRLELEGVESTAQRLDAQLAEKEAQCRQLRADFKCQEDDRGYLIKQIVGLKKEAAAAKEAVRAAATEQAEWEKERAAAQEEIQHWKQRAAAAEQARQALPTSTQMAERARKALQAEQRKVQSLQASLTAGMRQQQELQAVMRQCMADAREDRQAYEQQLDHKDVLAAARPYSAHPLGCVGSSPLSLSGPKGPVRPRGSCAARPASAAASSAFVRRPFSAPVNPQRLPTWTQERSEVLTRQQREKMLEALLAKEHVVALLYQQTTPSPTPPASGGSRPSTVRASSGGLPAPAGARRSPPVASSSVGGQLHAIIEPLDAGEEDEEEELDVCPLELPNDATKPGAVGARLQEAAAAGPHSADPSTAEDPYRVEAAAACLETVGAAACSRDEAPYGLVEWQERTEAGGGGAAASLCGRAGQGEEGTISGAGGGSLEHPCKAANSQTAVEGLREISWPLVHDTAGQWGARRPLSAAPSTERHRAVRSDPRTAVDKQGGGGAGNSSGWLLDSPAAMKAFLSSGRL